MSPALANHLLQSTIFAAIAALLALTLRNNHARTRYWVWLTASIKFLIPFSLFVEIGHRLTWSTASAFIAQPQVSFVMSEISQPFAVTPAVAVASAPSIIPVLLFVTWICGAMAVLLYWFARWLRVAASLRTATSMHRGREFESLQRLGGTTKLLSAPTSIEPGVFGILQPVLSLPSGIADHLDDLQLDAIIAHELAHIRRRDNLTAALHMLVEAIFWFHPLVWWLGTRLVEERERACDEEVVRLGVDPEVYAESILKICRYYLATPLPCAAGISGSELRKRIETIMANPVLPKLGAGKKLFLAAAGLLAILTPVAMGIATASPSRAEPAGSPHLQFEAASIASAPLGPVGRSGGLGSGQIAYQSVALGALVQEAYGITEDHITAPGWIYLENYSLNMKIPAGTTAEQYRTMLQNLLADRFRLAVHHSTRESPGYELVVAKNGSKLKDSASVPNGSLRRTRRPDDPRDIAIDKDGFPDLGNLKGMSVINLNGRSLEACHNCSLKTLLGPLAHLVGTWTPGDRYAPVLTPALVVDKTGLTGEYDFTLVYTDHAENGNDIREALEQQLGLELKASDIPVDLLVVDHVEKASSKEIQ